MIISRAKSVCPTKSLPLFRVFNDNLCRSVHTRRGKQSHSNPHRERPHKALAKRRKPIPFVTQVKDVQDANEALSLFQDYSDLGFKHDYPAYSALLYKLARSRNFEAVENVLTHIQYRDLQCQETVFVALIQHYGSAQLPEKAMELFRRMPRFNCVRTLQSLNALLNVLVNNGQFSNAKEVFDGSMAMGLRPNSISFNIMMKGWLAKGEWDKACSVFDEMLERKVQPSVVTYNSLIGFLSRKGDLDKAMTLLEDMTRKGKYPNQVTYALIMEGLCSVGKFVEAKKMMFDMSYRGCKPGTLNFGVLMSDLGKRGKIDEAKALLHEMKKRGFKADVVTFNIFINYLCRELRAAEAYKILVDMQVGGCQPNAATFRMMVDGFCRVANFGGGLKVFNAMLSCKHCPRTETFNSLVIGLLSCGEIDGACFVLEEMQKRNIQLDSVGWETLVTNACSENKVVSGLVNEVVSS